MQNRWRRHISSCLAAQRKSARIRRKDAQRRGQAEFETAAIWRNRIRALTGFRPIRISTCRTCRMPISSPSPAAAASLHPDLLHQVGLNYGNRSYFLTHNQDSAADEVLGAFLGQFYEDKSHPRIFWSRTSRRKRRCLRTRWQNRPGVSCISRAHSVPARS